MRAPYSAAMVLPKQAKPVRLGRALLAVIVLAAFLAGGFIGSRLPIATVPLRVVEGQAWLMSEGGKGSFRSDDGMSASFHDDVVWTGFGGTVTSGGRPSCLWDDKTQTPQSKVARVEAGYRWVTTPDGVSFPVVAWLKCLRP